MEHLVEKDIFLSFPTHSTSSFSFPINYNYEIITNKYIITIIVFLLSIIYINKIYH